MLEIQKVLFPTDFSEASDQALPYAVALSESFGAELHMLHALVLHSEDPANPGHRFREIEDLQPGLERRADERLRARMEEHGTPPLVVTAHRRGIGAAPVILEYAAEQEIDVVVMGTHGRRGLRHLAVGSVTESVTRLAPCPVLTVRQADPADGRLRSFERVLVPVDFTPHSDRALAHAVELALEWEGEVHLLHVVEALTYPDYYYPSQVTRESMLGEVERRVEGRLERAMARIRDGGVRAALSVETGPVARTIARVAAEEKFDLVVVGSEGKTGVERALLGSVAEGVIRRSSAPVLVVKLSGKSLVGEAAGGYLAEEPRPEPAPAS